MQTLYSLWSSIGAYMNEWAILVKVWNNNLHPIKVNKVVINTVATAMIFT